MSDSYPSGSQTPSTSRTAAFGQPPVDPWATTPSGRPIDDESVGEQGRRPILLVALIAAAVVVVGLAAWLLLGGSGGGTTEAAAPTPSPSAAPTPSPSPTPQETLPGTFDGVSGTDPFRPLVVPPVAASSGAAGAGAGATQGTGAAGTGALPTAPAGPGGGSGSTAAPSKASTPPSVHLALTDVTATNTAATFAVDGRLTRVLVGDEFAKWFRLLRLEGGRCATVQYGDEGVDLCEGDQLQL